MWPLTLLTKDFELLKLPREPHFLNGSSHTGNKANFISAVQLCIPEILSSWHSHGTQRLSEPTRPCGRHQPCELLRAPPLGTPPLGQPPPDTHPTSFQVPCKQTLRVLFYGTSLAYLGEASFSSNSFQSKDTSTLLKARAIPTLPGNLTTCGESLSEETQQAHTAAAWSGWRGSHSLLAQLLAPSLC